MKKFLVFLVSIVVVVCVGLTTYYFLRNDEIINFKTKEIYCNSGDIITLKDLGYERIKEYRKTTIDYNAGGEEVTNFIRFDETNGYYVVGENGGDVKLVIKTSNEKFTEFTVNVHIGNGSAANPYYINDEAGLSKIGNAYALNKHFQLQNDIIVSNAFKTIGYNAATSSWVGFSGGFDGNGYKISGLNVSNLETSKAGLFSEIKEGAVVKNLTIENANISGNYASAGVLAGEIYGTVLKVEIKNSSVSSSQANANVGALAGVVGKISLATLKATNVEVSAIGANSNVGGFVGLANESFIQACYASKANVTGSGSSNVGGFVGKFVIGTTSGSIQQSYANATSSSANFAGFIGEISVASGFDVNNSTMLRFLIGNAAVSNGTVVKTVNVPNNADGTAFFKSFYDTTSGFYLISNFTSEAEMASANSIIFYELDPETANTKVNWDSNVWVFEENMLPELRATSLIPAGVPGEYIRRSLNKIFVDSYTDIVAGTGKEFVLISDITLPSGWTPINLNNNTFNGKNYSIYFDGAGNTSVFGTITDSTVKNVNLRNVKTTSASNGALASSVVSTDSAFASTIENVNVYYTGTASGAADFGGIVGTLNKSVIKNSKVEGLNYVGGSTNVGGLVCVADYSTISNCVVNGTVLATTNVGGVVSSNNNSTLSNISGSVVVKYLSNNPTIINVGGVAAVNAGVISTSTLNVTISATGVASEIRIGGVAAVNNGTITSTVLNGGGISVDASLYIAVVGGFAAYNNSVISNSRCFMNQIGTFTQGVNHVVGGVAAYNYSTGSGISKVVVSSDIYGNIVGGAVAVMNNSASAYVDQVLVARFNNSSKAVSANTIKGDIYVAGIVMNLSAGVVTNIQTCSNLIGAINTTRTSLAVLVFPDGAILRNAAINSSFEGNGTFYIDTWNDFSSTAPANSGFLSHDASYNVYASDVSSGSFQSVVINIDQARSKGFNNYKQSSFTGGWAFLYKNPDYANSSESSYYKVVGNGTFSSASTFKTDWSEKVDNAGVFASGWLAPEYTKSMTFDFNSVWKEVSGAMLRFL